MMRNSGRTKCLWLLAAACTFFSLSGAPWAFADPFEVWLVDQSNSFGKDHGGTIYIYDGHDLRGQHASSAVPTDVIDLAGDTTALCSATGAPPVRPHMLLFNSASTHAILSFVTSGHVVIVEAATRAPLTCLRMSAGATNPMTGVPFRQAHAAFPAPDGSYILVANQNGKLLERINSDYATNTFTLDTAATLDLLNCTTPTGVPCEQAGVRPNNVPICPIVDSSSTLGFVTLGGGGLFVVDATKTPMAIVAEYDAATVHGNGCGGAEVRGHMYLNAGAGTETGNPSEFDVYQFPLSGYAATNPPNTPAPVVVFSDDSTPGRDSHGMVPTGRGHLLWVFDRGLNVAEVFRSGSGKHVNTVDLIGPDGDDQLAPDLGDIAPGGHRIFVSLRGPTPLSGSPHVATGSTPGLGVIRLTPSGRSGILAAVIPISNMDADGVERADAHAIRVRRK